jgi:hypothetical protein
MALKVDLDVSSDNIQDWKGVRQKAGQVNSPESSITNNETYPLNLQRALTPVSDSNSRFTRSVAAWAVRDFKVSYAIYKNGYD